MNTLTSNIDIIAASDQEVRSYFKIAAISINSLLEEYNIYLTDGKKTEISSDTLKAHFSLNGFFQPTPLKSIFFNQKKPLVPQEITYEFQRIISDAPMNVKAFLYRTFITLLSKKGWDIPLLAYLARQYNLPSDSTIILSDLKDFSLGSGVFRVTFQLRTATKEKVIVFLKKSHPIDQYNELLYFKLQKELLPTASYAQPPCILLSSKNDDGLLLSPSIPGVSSDTALALIIQSYKNATIEQDKSDIKKSFEILIEAFMHHAALGDLLLRNDRNLMNSQIAFIVDDALQQNTLEDLMDPEKILAYSKEIIKKKIEAISLIDLDLKWLLEEKNAEWILSDIDFGQSELNLLSLLTEFNDYNSKENPYLENRKKYIARYFKVYCRAQTNILLKKELLFSAIKTTYPLDIGDKKLEILSRRIDLFEKSKAPIIEMFKRYLLDFRIRSVYKKTIIALNEIAKQSNNRLLLTALKKADLLKFLQPQSTFAPYGSSVLLQLQCFRGVLSRNDKLKISDENQTRWEDVSFSISTIAEKFYPKIFNDLEDKIKFIKNDTEALLDFLPQSSSRAHQ